MNRKWCWDSSPCNYDVKEDQPWLVDDNGNRVLWGEIHCDLNDNAYLIAAAPELLEALIDCRRVLEIANFTQELAVVNAAIAKAKGE